MVSSFSLALPLLAATVSNAYYDHRIVVGGPNLLAYTPSSIKAEQGDTITFEFHQKNHTATQAAFDSPCSPLSGGFNSGFHPVAPDTQSGFPTYTITVNDTKPIWAYCAQPGPPPHCQQGMVFAANAPDYGQTFDAFKNKAMSLSTTASSTAPSSTQSAQHTDHRIVVGGPNQLVYTPSSIKAEQGDTITFEFHEKNHTATQAAFASPCSPLSGGFNSGFHPVAPGTQSGFPTYTITVNDTKPIWAYCAQPGPPPHCQQGMVFAANAPDYGQTFDAFRNKAMSLGSSSTSASSSASASQSSSAQYNSQSAGGGATVTETVTETKTVTETTASCSTAAASSGSPVTHTIVVGGTQDGKPLLAYTPPTVVANVGDFIEFQFNVKNHTVTQSPFSNPCTKLETASNGTMVGFDSGFMPVAPGTTSGLPTFKIRVNDTAPIWGYCRQQGPPVHCTQGMVFGINSPTSGPNTFAAFQQLAIHSNVTALY